MPMPVRIEIHNYALIITESYSSHYLYYVYQNITIVLLPLCLTKFVAKDVPNNWASFTLSIYYTVNCLKPNI